VLNHRVHHLPFTLGFDALLGSTGSPTSGQVLSHRVHILQYLYFKTGLPAVFMVRGTSNYQYR
jgi:hypothetical protein